MKKLCNSSEVLEINREEYISLVKDGKFICIKCGRVAVNEENLCRPVLLDSQESDLEEFVGKNTIDDLNEEEKLKLEEIMKLDETIVIEESESKKHIHHKHKHKKIKIINREKLIKLIHKEVRKEIKHYSQEEH